MVNLKSMVSPRVINGLILVVLLFFGRPTSGKPAAKVVDSITPYPMSHRPGYAPNPWIYPRPTSSPPNFS